MTKNTRRGKHLPSIEFTMFRPTDGRILRLINDIGHRTVTVSNGKTADRLGYRTVRIFDDRDSLREFVEARLEQAENAGYVAV